MNLDLQSTINSTRMVWGLSLALFIGRGNLAPTITDSFTNVSTPGPCFFCWRETSTFIYPLFYSGVAPMDGRRKDYKADPAQRH